MAYKYNPLLKYNLQKIQQNSGEDTQKKVPKFFASIDEIDVDEIGEYQGETSETFTRGFFYERKDAVTITELGTSTDYVFSNYLDAYINNEVYHQQYFISSNYGLSVTQYMTQSCEIGDNLITVIMFSTEFLKTNFAENYTNWNGTFYIYPYARIINGSITKFDYNNKLSIVNNVIYYKDQALNFTQSSRGVSNVYVGMEIDTHLIYMWIPLFPGWIAFALDTAQVHAAYTETWSIFKIVDRFAVSRLTPSAHVTANDYEFTDQTPYAQVDTQNDLYSNYLNEKIDDYDSILIDSNAWKYDSVLYPFPSGFARVYIKENNIIINATVATNSYQRQLYYVNYNSQNIFYLGGYPDGAQILKQYSCKIPIQVNLSIGENNALPVDSMAVMNYIEDYRNATTSLKGFMSPEDKSRLNNLANVQHAVSITSSSQATTMFNNVTNNITFYTSVNINLTSTVVIPSGTIGIYIPYSTSTAVIISAESNATTVKAHHKISGTWIN